MAVASERIEKRIVEEKGRKKRNAVLFQVTVIFNAIFVRRGAWCSSVLLFSPAEGSRYDARRGQNKDFISSFVIKLLVLWVYRAQVNEYAWWNFKVFGINYTYMCAQYAHVCSMQNEYEINPFVVVVYKGLKIIFMQVDILKKSILTPLFTIILNCNYHQNKICISF